MAMNDGEMIASGDHHEADLAESVVGKAEPVGLVDPAIPLLGNESSWHVDHGCRGVALCGSQKAVFVRGFLEASAFHREFAVPVVGDIRGLCRILFCQAADLHRDLAGLGKTEDDRSSIARQFRLPLKAVQGNWIPCLAQVKDRGRSWIRMMDGPAITFKKGESLGRGFQRALIVHEVIARLLDLEVQRQPLRLDREPAFGVRRGGNWRGL